MLPKAVFWWNKIRTNAKENVFPYEFETRSGG